jgi:hypothetical protein
VLTAAAAGYTLVTYDLRTIPTLLQTWATNGRRHHGVIFFDPAAPKLLYSSGN